MNHSGYYLGRYMAPFQSLMARTDITDIWINRPKELWFETLGGQIERLDKPELTHDFLAHLARQIAAMSSQGISREHPILSASLPHGERVQIVGPPATRNGVAVAIRKHVSAKLSLADYEKQGAFSNSEMVGYNVPTPSIFENSGDLSGEDLISFLSEAVRARKNIMISGGTSSGKTTFANALMREIPKHERIITIEDTPELEILHDNAVGLLAARSALSEAQVTADDLLNASLRMRPDRIILGEVRGTEAFTFLRAINTGHPGSITTIHADSPSHAIDQLALLVLQSGARLAWNDVIRYVRSTIDLFIQLERRDGNRKITQIMTGDEIGDLNLTKPHLGDKSSI